jgi:siroheme synthase
MAKRSKSLKRPKVYDALVAAGMSHSSAAAISNQGTTHAKRVVMAKKAAKTRKRRGK